ncbi:MAG: fibronectin type III domain-containing protein [Planctomycetota bacterium]|nr:fibronectin type III domain-containing protein [Planctomycetota bacterium]
MRALLRPLLLPLPIVLVLTTLSCNSSGGSHGGPDTQPPVFGGVMAAIPIDDTIVILQWNPAMDDRDPVAAITYRIYIATAPGSQNFSIPDATTTPGEIQHTALGLTPNTTYFFVIRAADTAGNEDSNTIEISARTPALPDTMAPIFGGALVALAISEFSIDVSWLEAMDDNTPQQLIVYKAYVATSSGAQNFFAPSATSAPGSTSMIVGGLSPTTTYFIVVRAEDAVGNEDTNFVEVFDTTLTPDLTAPVFSGLGTAVSLNPTRMNLTWLAASDNRAQPSEIVYNIYRASSSGGQSFITPNSRSTPGAVTWQLTGLTPNTDYFIVVRAEDPSGNEDLNTVEVLARTLVSFGANVLQIFTSTCAVSNCHGGTTPVLGQNLSNYSSIFNTAINIPAQQPSPQMDRIEPFSSGGSYLQHKIDGTHLSVGGSGDQSPKNSPPLTPATRDIIRDWINQGAFDN